MAVRQSGYSAQDYARDFAIFRRFAEANVPDMALAGPGSVGEAVLQPRMPERPIAHFVSTDAMLSASPPPKYDLFSYHFYGAVSMRCASMGADVQITPEAALSEDWLARVETSYDFYVRGLRDRYEPGKPIWITETADAACGGNPWAATFLDTFRFLDQLGRLAKQGVSVVFHNTLASSEYGLLDQNTFEPRSNYWAALLWRRLMGSSVLDAGPLEVPIASLCPLLAWASRRRDTACDQSQPDRDEIPRTADLSRPVHVERPEARRCSSAVERARASASSERYTPATTRSSHSLRSS